MLFVLSYIVVIHRHVHRNWLWSQNERTRVRNEIERCPSDEEKKNVTQEKKKSTTTKTSMLFKENNDNILCSWNMLESSGLYVLMNKMQWFMVFEHIALVFILLETNRIYGCCVHSRHSQESSGRERFELLNQTMDFTSFDIHTKIELLYFNVKMW